MRRIYPAVLAVLCLFMLTASGCIGFGYVVGSGPTIMQTYDFKDFTEVEISSSFEYEITQSANFGVSVSTHENILNYLDLSQSGRILYIRMKTSTSGTRAIISMPVLNRLSISGAVSGTVKGFKSDQTLNLYASGASRVEMDIESGNTDLKITGASQVTGTLKSQNLKLEVSGASQVNGLSLNAGDLKTVISGVSHCEIKGIAGDADIEISGASTLEATNLQTQNTDIEISGASQTAIFILGELSVNLSGASTLDYYGNPDLRKVNVSGASSLNKK